ncbi:MAG: hypothetical protein E4H08_03920 [Candidatus Atribacteria bacterium]|nr:MAG: hypothetical protein E4H08_03920 [Candidatus Atribacteria bacterium]
MQRSCLTGGIVQADERKLLSFDIEISDVFELAKDEDMEIYAPFHISVAATAIHEGEERPWFSENADGTPALNLTKQRAQEMLEYLAQKQAEGFMICAWNGLSFDLKWIGHQAENMELAARIALKSYDPMFQFFNQKGFPVGLAKVGAGMGIGQEKLMNGADAPREWRAGNFDRVKEYVMGDCQMTNLIVRAIQDAGEVRWLTNKGTISSEPMERLKTAEEVINDAAPDQSWMDTPLPKTKFHQWVQDLNLDVAESRGAAAEHAASEDLGPLFR